MTLFGITPALPLHKAGPYVAAAYIVFVAVVLIYVAIMARRLVRSQRDLAELKRELQAREQTRAPQEPAPAKNSERQVSHQL
jgi:HAMP domain-containing protein